MVAPFIRPLLEPFFSTINRNHLTIFFMYLAKAH